MLYLNISWLVSYRVIVNKTVHNLTPLLIPVPTEV